MPHRQQDIENWPISIKDLEPGYRAVFEWMPLSAQNDDLAKLFPLYTDKGAFFPTSRQAAGMLADFQRNRVKLNASGVHSGLSRLAVNADGRRGRPTCVQCGLCMYGCPYGLIYSSDQTLSVLVATGQVHYKSGVTVQSVEETSTGIRIQAVDLGRLCAGH
jgi:ferredoxin